MVSCPSLSNGTLSSGGFRRDPNFVYLNDSSCSLSEQSHLTWTAVSIALFGFLCFVSIFQCFFSARKERYQTAILVLITLFSAFSVAEYLSVMMVDRNYITSVVFFWISLGFLQASISTINAAVWKLSFRLSMFMLVLFSLPPAAMLFLIPLGIDSKNSFLATVPLMMTCIGPQKILTKNGFHLYPYMLAAAVVLNVFAIVSLWSTTSFEAEVTFTVAKFMYGFSTFFFYLPNEETEGEDETSKLLVQKKELDELSEELFTTQ